MDWWPNKRKQQEYPRSCASCNFLTEIDNNSPWLQAQFHLFSKQIFSKRCAPSPPTSLPSNLRTSAQTTHIMSKAVSTRLLASSCTITSNGNIFSHRPFTSLPHTSPSASLPFPVPPSNVIKQEFQYLNQTCGLKRCGYEELSCRYPTALSQDNMLKNRYHDVLPEGKITLFCANYYSLWNLLCELLFDMKQKWFFPSSRPHC